MYRPEVRQIIEIAEEQRPVIPDFDDEDPSGINVGALVGGIVGGTLGARRGRTDRLADLTQKEGGGQSVKAPLKKVEKGTDRQSVPFFGGA